MPAYHSGTPRFYLNRRARRTRPPHLLAARQAAAWPSTHLKQRSPRIAAAPSLPCPSRNRPFTGPWTKPRPRRRKRADSDRRSQKQLQRLAASLNAKHPGAAASLREGLDETLTVQALGITGALYRTLRTTNPIENLNGSIAHFTRNVKRWKDGQMTLRWVAGALSDAKGRFRKLRGHRDMKHLLAVLKTKSNDAIAAQRKAA